MEKKEIQIRFDEKIKELEQTLPAMTEGVNCCELTFNSILNVLGIDDHKFHNLAMPLAGGFGGYKANDGWQGACAPLREVVLLLGLLWGEIKRWMNLR